MLDMIFLFKETMRDQHQVVHIKNNSVMDSLALKLYFRPEHSPKLNGLGELSTCFLCFLHFRNYLELKSIGSFW